MLRQPEDHYGPELGGKALMAQAAAPETVLFQGLVLDDAALRKATVDRHGPARCQTTSHQNDYERDRPGVSGTVALGDRVRRSSGWPYCSNGLRPQIPSATAA